MIDDAEPAVHLAVRTQAPNLVQLEGWTHRFRDIDRHLRCKGYGEEAVSYYKACIGYLLSANSKQAMHDRYRKEFECVWPKDFVHYYRNKLLPRYTRALESFGWHCEFIGDVFSQLASNLNRKLFIEETIHRHK